MGGPSFGHFWIECAHSVSTGELRERGWKRDIFGHLWTHLRTWRYHQLLFKCLYASQLHMTCLNRGPKMTSSRRNTWSHTCPGTLWCICIFRYISCICTNENTEFNQLHADNNSIDTEREFKEDIAYIKPNTQPWKCIFIKRKIYISRNKSWLLTIYPLSWFKR